MMVIYFTLADVIARNVCLDAMQNESPVTKMRFCLQTAIVQIEYQSKMMISLTM